jgi:NitT/TauT family transport system ATP-binding protein
MSARPARPVASFDNPGFGDANVRDTEACFALLKELRHTVEDLW